MSDTPPKQTDGLASCLKCAKSWFFHANIGLVQLIPFGTGGLLLLLWPAALKLFFNDEILQTYGLLHIPYTLLIMSLAGIAGIIRREYYWSTTVTLKGPWAVFVSVIFTAILIATGLFLLLYGGSAV